jgi:hypothetical protein
MSKTKKGHSKTGKQLDFCFETAQPKPQPIKSASVLSFTKFVSTKKVVNNSILAALRAHASNLPS